VRRITPLDRQSHGYKRSAIATRLAGARGVATPRPGRRLNDKRDHRLRCGGSFLQKWHIASWKQLPCSPVLHDWNLHCIRRHTWQADRIASHRLLGCFRCRMYGRTRESGIIPWPSCGLPDTRGVHRLRKTRFFSDHPFRKRSYPRRVLFDLPAEASHRELAPKTSDARSNTSVHGEVRRRLLK